MAAKRATGKKSSYKNWDYIAALLFMAIFVLDRLAKIYLYDSCLWLFCIKRAFNNGAAFGILPEQTLFLAVVALAVLVVLAIFYRESDKLSKIAIVLVAAGTVSNLFDRLVYGYVIDMLKIWGSSSFNIADLSNLVGVVLFIVALARSSGRRKR